MPTWRRNLVLIMAAYVLLSVGLYVVQSEVLSESYDRLERSHAERDLERARNALQQQLQYLDRSAYDWAAWDDTYAFMADHNEAYVRSNLIPGTMDALGINLIAFVDPGGNLVFSRAVDLETEEEITIAEFAGPALDASDPLLAHHDVESHIAGIEMFSQGPMLVASRPIITSADEGPIRGTLIMGLLLDARLVQELSQTTELDVRVQALDSANLSAADRAALPPLLAGDPPLVQPVDGQVLFARSLLRDLHGDRALMLSVVLSRDFYQQGLDSRRRLAWALVLSSAAFLVVVTMLGRRATQEAAQRKRAEDGLLRAHEELEARVRQRTQQLSAANDLLEREIESKVSVQQQLQATLNEKELLLQELHHRVKNSLQVITNLLYLQATELKSPEAIKALEECRGRVRSIALLHSALETASEVGRVEFQAYAHTLAAEVLGSFGQEKAKLVVEGAPIYLATRHAVVGGLIVNELVTNALKHAFPDGEGGEVRLSVRAVDGQCVLEVADNGRGLPEGFDIHKSVSLGLRLVEMLAEQLHGELEIDSTQGTRFTLTFPIEEPQ